MLYVQALCQGWLSLTCSLGKPTHAQPAAVGTIPWTGDERSFQRQAQPVVGWSDWLICHHAIIWHTPIVGDILQADYVTWALTATAPQS
jgi:hypothetical protein